MRRYQRPARFTSVASQQAQACFGILKSGILSTGKLATVDSVQSISTSPTVRQFAAAYRPKHYANGGAFEHCLAVMYNAMYFRNQSGTQLHSKQTDLYNHRSVPCVCRGRRAAELWQKCWISLTHGSSGTQLSNQSRKYLHDWMSRY